MFHFSFWREEKEGEKNLKAIIIGKYLIKSTVIYYRDLKTVSWNICVYFKIKKISPRKAYFFQ